MRTPVTAETMAMMSPLERAISKQDCAGEKKRKGEVKGASGLLLYYVIRLADSSHGKEGTRVVRKWVPRKKKKKVKIGGGKKEAG
jgi:hypothetical protein